MYTILILTCSIANPGSYGCGPRSHLQDQMVTVGKANSEAECFMKGNKELPKYPDTDKVFHKVVCVTGG
jgi:hypothetical protein